MPKDYRKRKKSRSSKSKPSPSSSFGWIVFGILIGLFVAILFYWKQEVAPKRHLASAKVAVAGQHAGAKKPEKSTAPAAAGPEFDFYTVLPKMQVAPNNATATPSPTRPPAATAPLAAPSGTPVAGSVPVASSSRATAQATAAPAPVASNSAVTLLPLPTEPEEKTAPAPLAKTPAAKISIAASEAKVLALPTANPEAKIPAAPVVTPVAKASTANSAASTNYLLQMGSLKSYADADRLKAELTMSGFDVYIQPYTMNGEVYNRVVMGPYSSKAAALQQRTVLQKNHVSSVLIKAP